MPEILREPRGRQVHGWLALQRCSLRYKSSVPGTARLSTFTPFEKARAAQGETWSIPIRQWTQATFIGSFLRNTLSRVGHVAREVHPAQRKRVLPGSTKEGYRCGTVFGRSGTAFPHQQCFSLPDPDGMTNCRK